MDNQPAPMIASAVFVACPHCGMIHERKYRQDTCPNCQAQGHLYRLLTVEEMLRSALGKESRGYKSVALKESTFAANLVRHTIIRQCIRTAADAYGNAQRDGLDCDSKFDRAMEALEGMLKTSSDKNY